LSLFFDIRELGTDTATANGRAAPKRIRGKLAGLQRGKPLSAGTADATMTGNRGQRPRLQRRWGGRPVRVHGTRLQFGEREGRGRPIYVILQNKANVLE
jgi:hypothetical protein